MNIDSEFDSQSRNDIRDLEGAHKLQIDNAEYEDIHNLETLRN